MILDIRSFMLYIIVRLTDELLRLLSYFWTPQNVEFEQMPTVTELV